MHSGLRRISLKRTLVSAAIACGVFIGGCATDIRIIEEKRPMMSHVHFGHALTGWFDTRGKVGLFESAERIADDIAALGVSIDNRSKIDSTARMLRDFDRMRVLIGTPTEAAGVTPRSGGDYSLFSALQHANQHMNFAALSEDTSPNMSAAAAVFDSNVASVIARGVILIDVIDAAGQTANVADRARLVREIRRLSIQILEGDDSNGDGIIGTASGEFGLRQLRDELARAAAREEPPYQPVAEKYLFGVVRLPNGTWAFRDSKSGGGRYGRYKTY